MTFAFLSVSIAFFVVLIKLLGIGNRVHSLMTHTSEAMASMRSVAMTEDQKEQAVQRAATRVIGQSLTIFLLAIPLLGLPFLVLVLGADVLGLYSWEALAAASLSWEFLLAAGILTTLGFVFLK
ncbi:hypothetical protein CCR85_05265 [Rhodothalassium salexigens]|uniref:hypothetical protein n=1 Tax=Rhodothalassium salexigens TaxID=1086 RepID=UPI001912A434|nr:hypothetical protein [Rhodothalassium salexigens]MBK5910902.1 hypothetical protein [Rhodothalassium salexigens]